MIKLKKKPEDVASMQYWSWRNGEDENYYTPLTQEQCNFLAERLRELADADNPQEYVDTLYHGADWDANTDGVCTLLDALTMSNDYAESCMQSLSLPASWSKEFCSGNSNYPVPAPHDFVLPADDEGIFFTPSDSPACVAFFTLRHWDGEYGEMRRNYCHYMADRLEGMTDEEAG